MNKRAHKSPENPPTHAGAVTFRNCDGKTLYLLISSSNGLHWVLPKGHLEPGESSEAAALRELAEEAGVRGEIVESLDVQRYQHPQGEVSVRYFLVREAGSVEPQEKRTLRWEEEQQALRLLSFEEAGNALQKAAAILSSSRTG